MENEKRDDTTGFAMTPEIAELFFTRCVEKEAVTQEERIIILKNLVDEHHVKVLNKQQLKDVIKDKKIVVIKRKRGQRDRTN